MKMSGNVRPGAGFYRFRRINLLCLGFDLRDLWPSGPRKSEKPDCEQAERPHRARPEKFGTLARQRFK